MYIPFGELRSCVQMARTEHEKVAWVVWCVLHAKDRQAALEYACASLDDVDRGHVNLGVLVRWVVDGAPHLIERAENCFRLVDICEYLSAWSFEVCRRSHSSPPLTLGRMPWCLLSWVSTGHEKERWNWFMDLIVSDRGEEYPGVDSPYWSVSKKIPEYLKLPESVAA